MDPDPCPAPPLPPRESRPPKPKTVTRLKFAHTFKKNTNRDVLTAGTCPFLLGFESFLLEDPEAEE